MTLVINNTNDISARGLATDIDVINYAFTNILAGGFTNDLGIINILARGFTTDFSFIVNVFANISVRGLDSNFDIIGYAFINIFERETLPPTLV